MKHPPRCLHCRAPLPAFEGASQRCPVCDEVALRVDQRIFRTLEPGPRLLESLLKAVTVALLALLLWVLFTPKQMHIGMGQGWVIGFPVVIGYLLWETAESITRKDSDLRIKLVWALIPVSFLALVLVPLLLTIGVAFLGSEVVLLGLFGFIVWLFYGDRLSNPSVGARRYPEFRHRP